MDALNQSYSDVMLMPTMERRFYLKTKHEQTQKIREEVETNRNETQNIGKGRRKRVISGNAVNGYSGKV